MSVLLTGGLGFIGSHTFVELAKNNYDIIILDNLANSKFEQIKKLEELTGVKVNFYLGDMLNIEILDKIFSENKINHVIHFAGLKSVAESISKPIEYYSHNLLILFNLLDIMKKYNCKNLVFSSSATVYGNNIDRYYIYNGDCDSINNNNSTNNLTENTSTGQNITNPYGQTKYFQEEILKDLYNSDKSWNITLLRYFNPVGAHPSGIIGEDPNGIPANLFPCILRAIKEKTQLKIYGNTYNTHDGTCIRDFIHVCDLADAHVKVLNCKGLNIYNVGTGKKTSVLDIITTFEKVNNIKLDYVIAEKRPGDIECVCADCSKILNEIGWKSKYNVEDMCRDGYLYFINNYKKEQLVKELLFDENLINEGNRISTINIIYSINTINTENSTNSHNSINLDDM